jgi:hypothetical protein
MSPEIQASENDNSQQRVRSAYEALREQALEGSAGRHELGFTLLVRRGVAAWMQACASRPPASPLALSAVHSLVPPGLQSELTQLLAAMALFVGRKENCA